MIIGAYCSLPNTRLPHFAVEIATNFVVINANVELGKRGGCVDVCTSSIGYVDAIHVQPYTRSAARYANEMPRRLLKRGCYTGRYICFSCTNPGEESQMCSQCPSFAEHVPIPTPIAIIPIHNCLAGHSTVIELNPDRHGIAFIGEVQITGVCGCHI